MKPASDKYILQHIFRSFFAQHPDLKLPLRAIKAAEAIMQCQSTERGYKPAQLPQWPRRSYPGALLPTS